MTDEYRRLKAACDVAMTARLAAREIAERAGWELTEAAKRFAAAEEEERRTKEAWRAAVDTRILFEESSRAAS